MFNVVKSVNGALFYPIYLLHRNLWSKYLQKKFSKIVNLNDLESIVVSNISGVIKS